MSEEVLLSKIKITNYYIIIFCDNKPVNAYRDIYICIYFCSISVQIHFAFQCPDTKLV